MGGKALTLEALAIGACRPDCRVHINGHCGVIRCVTVGRTRYLAPVIDRYTGYNNQCLTCRVHTSLQDAGQPTLR